MYGAFTRGGECTSEDDVLHFAFVVRQRLRNRTRVEVVELGSEKPSV